MELVRGIRITDYCDQNNLSTRERLGDVRMIHHRESLPLGLEPSDDLPGIHAQLDDLERDTATDGFLLFRDIDHATTALAEILAELVAANTVAGPFGDRNYGGGDDKSFGGN